MIMHCTSIIGSARAKLPETLSSRRPVAALPRRVTARRIKLEGTSVAITVRHERAKARRPSTTALVSSRSSPASAIAPTTSRASSRTSSRRNWRRSAGRRWKGPTSERMYPARSHVPTSRYTTKNAAMSMLRAATASASGPHVLRSSSASGPRRYSQADVMGTARSSTYRPMAKKTRYCLACRTAVTRWGSVGLVPSMAREYTVLAEAPAPSSAYHEVMQSPRRVLVFLALSWVLVILYPDPGVLVRSVRNTLRPSVEPQAVAALARSIPDDPRAIEAYVLERQVPYAYDWQSAGVPWYFPTASEAMRAGRGDCESRALVLASLLTAKGIPNELRVSFDHIWVDYPGKQANALENAGVEFTEM